MQFKNKKNRILALILIGAIVITSFWNPSLVGVGEVKAEEPDTADIWDGSNEAWADELEVSDGSKKYPFKITSAAQFYQLATRVNAGTNYSGQYFSLECDIDLDNRNWEPIGVNSSAYFSGKLNGKGHTIRGLNIDGSYQYAGLFGYIKNAAEITSLVVEGCVNSTSPGASVGGLIGYLNDGTVKNCSVNVAVTGTEVSYGGGFAGYINGSTITTIVNCFARGNIECSRTGTGNFGGFAGYLEEVRSNLEEVGSDNSILNCYAVGDVAGTATTTANVNGFLGTTGKVALATSSESGAPYLELGLCFWNRDAAQSKNGTIIDDSDKMGTSVKITSVGTHPLSAAELKSDTVVAYLNGMNEAEDIYWTVDRSEEDPINGGYPYIVRWTSEDPNPYLIQKLAGVFDDTDEQTDIGTSNNPYTISSALQLQLLAYYTNRTTYFTRGMYIELTNDIDLKEMPMVPIGLAKMGNDGTLGFVGSFNGRGHTIRGLNIDGYYWYAGLFGYTRAATVITSLNVEGSVHTTYNEDKFTICAGGLIGNVCGGTVKNCSVDVTVTADIPTETANVGGFAGAINNGNTISSTTNTVTIENCFAAGDVNINKTSGNLRCGSFIGYLSVYGTGGSVMNCYAVGDVTGITTGELLMGGFCGYSYAAKPTEVLFDYWNQEAVYKANDKVIASPLGFGSIKSGGVYSETVQSLSENALKSEGLLIWLNDLNMEAQAYWTSDQAGIINQGNPYLAHWEGTGENPYARGKILAQKVFDSATQNGSRENPYTISTAVQFQRLSHYVNSTSSFVSGKYLNIAADIDLGGMSMIPIGIDDAHPVLFHVNGMGHIISGLKIDTSEAYAGLFGLVKGVTISNLSVNGQVSGTETFSGTGTAAGGIAGRLIDGAAIKYCSTNVAVKNPTTTGTAGGIVGTITAGTVQGCYTLGNVSGATAAKLGGVVGNNTSGTISGCFYNREALLRPMGVGAGVGYAGGLTANELKSEAFVTIINRYLAKANICWKQDVTKNNGYPFVSFDPNPYASLADNVFEGGAGTESNPYIIASKQQLYAFSLSVSDGNNYQNQYIAIDGNIDLSGMTFLPIGVSKECSFRGNLIGGGHTISNLSLAQAGNYTGLFGYIGEDGAINQLAVEGTVATSGSSANASIGLLAGMVDYGTLNYCKADGNITDTGNNSNASIGLLAGNIKLSNVEGCYALGEIQTTNQANVGGLIGSNQSATNVNSCYAAVDITAGAASLVGGIIGQRSNSESSGLYWSRDNNQVVGGVAKNAAARSGTGNANETGVTAMTTSEMKKASFANLLSAALTTDDFIWSVDLKANPVNNGYPYLISLVSLTGTVTVSGSHVYGQTLSADTTALEADNGLGTLTYQWLRDGDAIKGATQSEYTLTAADIGTVINVKVAPSVTGGSITTTQTTLVAKVAVTTVPSAPTVESKTDEMVSLKAVPGMEYRLGTDGTWTKLSVFSGLTKETEYTFYTREAETSTHSASAASAGRTVTTSGGPKLAQSAPTEPVLESKTTTSITVEAITNAEYSIGGIDWQSQVVFSDLTPGSTYHVYARLAGNTTHYASPASEPLEVRLEKETQEAPAAPTIASKSDTTVTLNTVSGTQYRLGETGTWQNSGVFSGLQVNVEYKFYARLAESATHTASEQSTALAVTLEKAAIILAEYKVTFDLNGAKGTAPKAQTVTQGSNATAPSNPVRSGYNFLGWYQESTCKSEWNFSVNGVTKNIVLYAYWEKSPSKPTKLAATTAYRKVKLSWKAAKNVDGYEIHRSTTKNGTYQKIKTITNPKTIKYTNKNLTKGQTYYYKIRSYQTVNTKKVYSKFSTVVEIKVKKLHKISFESNKGNKKKSQYILNKKRVSEPKEPLRKNYTFVGWYTDPKLTQRYNFMTKVRANLKLYAKWTKSLSQTTEVRAKVSSNSVTLSWNKVKGAHGYEVLRVTANDADIFTAEVSGSDKEAFTNSKLKAGRVYFYKIRAYKIIDGEKVYGKYSSLTTVKIQK